MSKRARMRPRMTDVALDGVEAGLRAWQTDQTYARSQLPLFPDNPTMQARLQERIDQLEDLQRWLTRYARAVRAERANEARLQNTGSID